MITKAQTYLLQDIPKDKTQLSLLFMRPIIKDSDLSPLSGIYDLSFNVPLKNKWNINGSLPYITSKYEDYESESGMGSIYIGTQKSLKLDEKQHSIVSFGLYLPTADEDAAWVGVLSNVEDTKYKDKENDYSSTVSSTGSAIFLASINL